MKRTNKAEVIIGVGKRVVRNLEVLGADYATGTASIQGYDIEVVTLNWRKGADRQWAVMDAEREVTPEDEVTEEDEDFFESRNGIRTEVLLE